MLLHHQVAAPRRRAPVHLAQRIALDVVAHAVEIEARRTLEQQPSSLARVHAGHREQPVELDQPGIHDESLLPAEWQLDAFESERILDDRNGLLERIAAARHGWDHVPRPKMLPL